MNRYMMAAVAALSCAWTAPDAEAYCRRQPVRNAARWMQHHRPLRRALAAPFHAIHETHHIEHYASASCDCDPCTCPPGDCHCPGCANRKTF